MSSVVAVAGGTGDVGRTIVEAIIADGKWTVVVLARNASEEKEKEIGARILPVNYDDVDDLVKVLEENKVHTVISTLSVGVTVKPELNLIAAADRAQSTQRCIPSVWSPKLPRELPMQHPLTQAKIDIQDALKKTTTLEHSSWYIGLFADYYVSPPLKSHLRIMPVVVDTANNAAAIPAPGDAPIVFTYSIDVAKFVVASLSLPKWRKESHLYNDKLTWNELVRTVESIKGVKFNVAYDSVESLKAGKITELPRHAVLYALWPKEQLQVMFSRYELMLDSGLFDVSLEHSITEDLPDIKLRSFKELLKEAWGPKA
ncbi:Oxidoreductase BOA1 [Colletotrichum shisoi]|uniref:Oxidoreductase BOA1 n=1 Tax=Colletotrichum shisoi TaxID=2078593 RepID=A0A5Q4BEJ2_9PEZI|nr:Oxidoreductase BOA1 [Colletotrichum shisoi]